jgi:transposase
MFSLHNARVWLATGATDLRRGFNGLHAMITHQFKKPALGGDLFVFTNRKHTMIKIFFWQDGGIWVCARRLERGTFRWPRPGQPVVAMTGVELALLLNGIDLRQTRRRRWWRPDEPVSSDAATTRPLAGQDDPQGS